jgi:hypothetical protein
MPERVYMLCLRTGYNCMRLANLRVYDAIECYCRSGFHVRLVEIKEACIASYFSTDQ